MRYLILALLVTLTFACGGVSNKVKTPEQSATPWENIINPGEREYYETVLECPDATEIANMAINWQLVEFEDGTENPKQIGENRFLSLRALADSVIAIIQFRVEPEGKVVVEGVLFHLKQEQILLFDYYVIRDLREGKVTVEMDDSVVFENATGDFFCRYLE